MEIKLPSFLSLLLMYQELLQMIIGIYVTLYAAWMKGYTLVLYPNPLISLFS